MSTKESAKDEFIEMIILSWTWDRLTAEEKAAFFAVLPTVLHGTFRQRFETCQLIYTAYLAGLGYRPIGWRD